ncbi:DUF3987 domain-containing protein [Limnohabitans sp.]
MHPDQPPLPAPDYLFASDETDRHRNAPVPDPACLYGLVGEVARAGSKGNESNPYAIATNFLAYLSCAIGRGTFLQIGNTEHHPRIFSLHVGRSGRGRKGDSLALVMKIDEFIRAHSPMLCPQIHRGGLSSREGLAALIHDGLQQGNQATPAVEDKRLWVVESEFANVLQQSRRKGNTLSTALRDCWDGVCIKPATKNNRVFASKPHVCLSGAITPSELTALMSSKDLSNGFANRFLIIWAERIKITAFPKPTPPKEIEYLATRTQEVLNFAKADSYQENNWLQMELSTTGKWHYGQMYRNVLAQDFGSERVSAVLERRAPMLLRLAIVFALCDLSTKIEIVHLEAALAWINFCSNSVQYVFSTAKEAAHTERISRNSNLLLQYLTDQGQSSRSDILRGCFKGHLSKLEIDACLDYLLNTSPPQIQTRQLPRVEGKPGPAALMYSLA